MTKNDNKLISDKNRKLSPSQAVKKYLLEDVCGSHSELKKYGGRWNFGNGRVKLKDIKANCLDCSGYELGRVRKCQIPDCPIYPFRNGKNSNRKGIGNHHLRPP